MNDQIDTVTADGGNDSDPQLHVHNAILNRVDTDTEVTGMSTGWADNYSGGESWIYTDEAVAAAQAAVDALSGEDAQQSATTADDWAADTSAGMD